MAKLVEAQLVADGTYPNAAVVFAAAAVVPASASPTLDYNSDQPRNLTDPGKKGQWTTWGSSGASSQPDAHLTRVAAEDPDPTPEQQEEALEKQLREREDPQKYFRQRFEQNGIIRIPPRPGGSGSPTVKPSPIGGGSEAPETPATAAPNTLPTQGPSVPAGAPSRPPALAPKSPSPSLKAEDPQFGSTATSGGLLYSIEVPPDLTLAASGRTIRARAEAYEAEARTLFDFSPAPKANALGDKVPDGVRGRLALEVKYVDEFQSSPRNPDYIIPYPSKIAEDDVAQAKKYDDEFIDGVLWVTNSPELAAIYEATFRVIGLTRSRVVVVPSVRK